MGVMSLGILRMPLPPDSDLTGRLQYEQTAKWAADEIELLRTQLIIVMNRVEELKGDLYKEKNKYSRPAHDVSDYYDAKETNNE
jgi:hypothetical protein